MSYSPATAVRRIASELATRRHRLAPKSAPPKNKLTCGLLGAGQFFKFAYGPALNRKSSSLVVAGMAVRNQDTFREAQRDLRYTIKPFFDFDTLFASGINATLIVLPNPLHSELARISLERNLNVFCEKPLGRNVAECLALKTIAQKSGRVLMVDFNQRYADRNRVLKQCVDEKRIGNLISVHAFHNQNLAAKLKSFAPLQREITGGGVLHNAGVHFVNLFLHWFGAVERVQAFFENRALPVECGEDTAHCQFWFRSGVTATLDASLANAVDTSYERVQFIGEAGEIASDFKKGEIVLTPRGKQQLKIPCRPEIMTDTVFNALEKFAQCVQSGARPETDVDDSIKTMKVIEALTLSAARGAAVRLDEIESNYA